MFDHGQLNQLAFSVFCLEISSARSTSLLGYFSLAIFTSLLVLYFTLLQVLLSLSNVDHLVEVNFEKKPKSFVSSVGLSDIGTDI